jgi:hypothetical protein
MRTAARARLAAAALAAPLALLVPADAGPPALLAQARYVALGYDRGDAFVSETEVREEVLPEEREALQRIRAGLEQWGRYVIVLRPGDAELLIAVRKGRLASFFGGIPVGGPSAGRAGGGPMGSGPMAGAQVSSPDDMIEVFDAGGSLVWRGMKPNGLSGAGPPLWESFQAEVAKVDKRAKKP